jgi:hypothetical protein
MLRLGGAVTALAVGIIATSCDSPTMPQRVLAYQFTWEGPSQRIIYRWPDGHTIRVHVVQSPDPERREVLNDAVRHAARVWNDAVLYGEYRIELAPLERADVIVAWQNEPLPIDTDECPPVPGGFAWTTFCQDTVDLSRMVAYPLLEGEHHEDGVHMIVQVIDDPLTEGHIPALVAHEFGHVLGIGTHPCHFGALGCTGNDGRRRGAHASVMFEGLPEQDAPSQADRETVQLLYHTTPHLVP